MAVIRKLTEEEQAALNALAAIPDSEIDTSDMPEVMDWSGAVRGALYRPVKLPTSPRLDADVLEWFERGDGGYQTRINAALREYVERLTTAEMSTPFPYPITRHNRSPVNGIAGKSRPPIASATALVTAHSAPVVPASPIPFTPRGLNGDGVSHPITR